MNVDALQGWMAATAANSPLLAHAFARRDTVARSF
jgi:hypothetical protein